MLRKFLKKRKENTCLHFFFFFFQKRRRNVKAGIQNVCTRVVSLTVAQNNRRQRQKINLSTVLPFFRGIRVDVRSYIRL